MIVCLPWTFLLWLPQGEETFADAKLMTDDQLEGKLRFHNTEVERLEAEAEVRKRKPSKEEDDWSQESLRLCGCTARNGLESEGS
jgi:hypothetical protein